MSQRCGSGQLVSSCALCTTRAVAKGTQKLVRVKKTRLDAHPRAARYRRLAARPSASRNYLLEDRSLRVTGAGAGRVSRTVLASRPSLLRGLAPGPRRRPKTTARGSLKYQQPLDVSSGTAFGGRYAVVAQPKLRRRVARGKRDASPRYGRSLDQGRCSTHT